MEDNRVLTDNIITKYHTAASICGKVYISLKSKIIDLFYNAPLRNDNERNLLNLTSYGNNLIKHELSNIYKKSKDKNIAFPVSISLNNCVGHYIYNHDNPDSEFNTIKETDVIKIELGVSIDGCISILAETFTINENLEIKKITDFLDKMQKILVKKIKHEETADEMRMLFESKCTENDIFPIENCMSYQQLEGHLNGDTLKYMILNYHKYYDMDDYLISPENINYEFEEHDIYTINLSVTPTRDDNDNDDNIKYKNKDESHIYRLNEYTYSLKLKSSKIFYNQIKTNHSNYAFDISLYNHDAKNRMGIKECLDNNILDAYPIKYVCPSNIPVITKKFTIIVGKNDSKLLKYF
jgi:methionine aminopeptidase